MTRVTQNLKDGWSFLGRPLTWDYFQLGVQPSDNDWVIPLTKFCFCLPTCKNNNIKHLGLPRTFGHCV